MTPLVTVQRVRVAFDQGESGLSWHRASNVSPAMRLCWGSGIPKVKLRGTMCTKPLDCRSF